MNPLFILSRPKGLAFFRTLRSLYSLSIEQALPIAAGRDPLPSEAHVAALEAAGARVGVRKVTESKDGVEFPLAR